RPLHRAAASRRRRAAWPRRRAARARRLHDRRDRAAATDQRGDAPGGRVDPARVRPRQGRNRLASGGPPPRRGRKRHPRPVDRRPADRQRRRQRRAGARRGGRAGRRSRRRGASSDRGVSSRERGCGHGSDLERRNSSVPIASPSPVRAGRLLSVNVGLPREVEWEGKTVRTAIWKAPVEGPQMVRRINIEGDDQADRLAHGGEHRAVFVYQIESYRYWEGELGRDDFSYGQFGENFTVEGLADDEVCIGDRYRIGEALFEVTQPRVT